ncbi:hypothetical protein U3516DRAFT_790641 [Neocallimastix sp. 'constans']
MTFSDEIACIYNSFDYHYFNLPNYGYPFKKYSLFKIDHGSDSDQKNYFRRRKKPFSKIKSTLSITFHWTTNGYLSPPPTTEKYFPWELLENAQEEEDKKKIYEKRRIMDFQVSLGTDSKAISLNDDRRYELLSTNTHHCSGIGNDFTALNKACMNEHGQPEKKWEINRNKKNEDGPWLDGHLPKEEITGHGGHFEFYRASMSINGTMAVKLWQFKYRKTKKGKFRAKLENEMITNPIFMDINDFTKINVTQKDGPTSYRALNLFLYTDFPEDLILIKIMKEREITEKFKDRSNQKDELKKKKTIFCPSSEDEKKSFKFQRTIIDFLEDTKHSLHQQQLKNSQAFNINLVRINMEGRTALIENGADIKYFLIGINTNSVKNDLL